MDIEEEQHQQQNCLEFKKLPKIQVLIRKRPLNGQERSRQESDIVDIYDKKELVLQEQKVKVDLTKFTEDHSFMFDNAYDQDITNREVYTTNIQPLVFAAGFQGAKVTVFAYGQTGSGKTFTMMGDQQQHSQQGLYLMAAQDLFRNLQPNYRVVVSFYEIYCGKLFDLLNDRNQLIIREDGKKDVNIIGLSELTIQNEQQMMETIQKGMGIRITSITGMNLDSSRSHAILQINIKEVKTVDVSRRAGHPQWVEKTCQVGKLSFIDLAGNERASDVTEQNKQTRLDGAEINKSLLALKECIRALDMDKTHVPFRQNKLTLVLKDSFVGGQCKSVMIGNISPSTSCCEHTLNTLRYADRVKELRKGVPSKDKDNLMLARPSPGLRQTNNTSQVNQLNKRNSMVEHNQIAQMITPNKQQLIRKKNQFSQEKENIQQRAQLPRQPQGLKRINEESSLNQQLFMQKINNCQAPVPQQKYSNNHFDQYQPSTHYEQSSLTQHLSQQQEQDHPSQCKADLLVLHRQNINDMVEITKHEMQLVASQENDQASFQQYTSQLENILENKVELLQMLLTKVKAQNQAQHQQALQANHHGFNLLQSNQFNDFQNKQSELFNFIE